MALNEPNQTATHAQAVPATGTVIVGVVVALATGLTSLLWLGWQAWTAADAAPLAGWLPLAIAALVALALFLLALTTLLLARQRDAAARAAEIRRGHLSAAMEAAPLGTWEWDIASGEIRWSPAVWRMFGLAPDSRRLDFELFRNALHPDDREQVMQTLEQALAHGNPYHLEARILRPDGSVHWMRSHGQPLGEDSGRPLRIVGVDLDITAQKESEAERRASEELFATAFEATVLGMAIVAPSGRWLTVNGAFCALLGYTADELLALDFQTLTHPDDLPTSLAERDRLYAGEIPFLGQEKRYRHRDGHYLWVYVTVGLVRYDDGTPRCHVTQVQDIDARKRAEEALAAAQVAAAAGEREREELLVRLNEAQHAAGIGSWDWDIGSGRVWWSDELYRIFELDPARYKPSVATDSAYVHEADREAYHALVERSAAEGSEFDYELRIVTGRGRERFCRSRGCVERSADGSVRRVFGTFQDRTEARALEERMRQAHKLESLGSLAGGIAHDFNNLLAAILGNATLARRHADDRQAVEERIQRIEEAGQRAKTLVDQILSFSRRQPMQLAPTDVGALVRELVSLLRATIPAGIALSADIDDTTPQALVDPSQLHQILMNLCTNAWHAVRERNSPGGLIALVVRGVELDATAAHAIDARLGPGRYCRIEVIDDGIGMDPEMREKIFEPFFTTRAPGSGTGLGLSVVHGLVTALHGAIEVESARGLGSRFVLYFPEAPAAAVESPSSPAPAGDSKPATAGRHVLYVDDEPALRVFVRELLEFEGFEVTVCASAYEALQQLHERAAVFDVVVTDYNMPGHSGLDVAAEVARHRPGLPVIISSGYFTPELQRKAETLGVLALVNKADLVSRLPTLLKSVLAVPDG